MEERNYQRRGYLKESFRLFHLRDIGVEEMEYHYHEFHKAVFFLAGSAGYLIEGRSYFLQPGDVLLVGRHLIHKPVIDPTQPYERVILYLDPDLLDGALPGEESLAQCFRLAQERRFALMRPVGEDRQVLAELLGRLEQTLKEPEEFGGELLARSCLFQLLIRLNRMALRDTTSQREGVSRFDPKIAQILDYINGNLAADLSVDTLAARCYASKFHFMRRFRALTGYSVHQYVSEKRLLAAAELLRQGVSAQEAGLRCGFQDYSAFQRAFKRQFGLTPRQLRSGERPGSWGAERPSE